MLNAGQTWPVCYSARNREKRAAPAFAQSRDTGQNSSPLGGVQLPDVSGGFRVRHWREFQHYRDRNPPWIKLHFALLSSADWVMLDDASRVLAIACMLVASRNDGLVPDDPAYLKRVAYLRKLPNFKPLIDCGFLEYDSDCKQLLATARPEERQRRGETQSLSEESSAELLNGKPIAFIPLNDGSQFGVLPELAAELHTLYPAVDTQQTLNEIRAWNLSHPAKRKTSRGITAHITSWFTKEQDRHGR